MASDRVPGPGEVHTPPLAHPYAATMNSATESPDELRRRMAAENRLRRAAENLGLKMTRGRGGEFSPDRGLYRLKDEAGDTALETYVLGEVEAYLAKRAEEMRSRRT